jgi:hypothetical protein
MRDFPLHELLSAAGLKKIQDALSGIFVHLNKKLRESSYPIRRALPLVGAISGDLDSQLQSPQWSTFGASWVLIRSMESFTVEGAGI